MIAKPIVPRELANLDVDEAIAYYLSEASDQVALGFVDALDIPADQPAPSQRVVALWRRAEPAGPALMASQELPAPRVLLRNEGLHRRLARASRYARYSIDP